MQGPDGFHAGLPIYLPLDAIDEDPEQPRSADNPGFSTRSLSELADSIRQRGIKTPISVRPHPADPGRYLLNHGARRLRASRIAGKPSIPAFIDADYSQADQVVENLHRDGLTAREIADYIGRELSKGLKRKQIAQQISKSAAFVTQHARLLDLPEPLAAAFNAGRVRDVTVVNELATAHQQSPAEVARWLDDDRQEITRGTVLHLRQFLAQRASSMSPPIDPAPLLRPNGNGEVDDTAPRAAKRLGSAKVQVMHRRRSGCMVLTRRPTRVGHGWVQFDETGTLEEVPLADVRIVALSFGSDLEDELAVAANTPSRNTEKSG